ncbi:MAG: SPOR domain-containing protein, partial [Albidovulum sp.]
LQAGAWRAVACFAALALAGCVAGTKPERAVGDTATARAAASPVSVTRDVEAPEVFSVKGQGLWDGRPSLGGVWVAHASVKDPERVIIRNTKTGKSVVGALFRRERDLPGPGLQVSSDAAEALGLLAGQPADLSVVALRREEKPVPADAEIGATDEVAEVVAVPAAADSAAATQPATGSAVAAAGARASAESPGAGAADAAPAAEAPKKSGGLFGFLKRKPKERQAGSDSVAAGAANGTIEQTPLDPVATIASAAIDRAEAAATTPKTASPPVLSRSYIQIGIFSIEANANRAAAQMKDAGMTATVRPDQGAGKTYWRVIVGPAASVAEREALVARVKSIGYPDAYPVAN